MLPHFPSARRLFQRALIVLISIPILTVLSGCYFSTKALAKSYEEAKAAPFDAVIVPGTPFESGRWNFLMQLRVNWAVHLYKQGLAKSLIFSGAAVYTPYNEAGIMALYAEALGVPRAHILLEPSAEHSAENLFLGFQVARDHGLNGRIGIATDPFQASLLRGLAHRMERQLCADIEPIPVVFAELNTLNLPSPDIDPSSAYEPGFVSIKEREGLLQRMSGTRGSQLDWHRVRADRARAEPVGMEQR